MTMTIYFHIDRLVLDDPRLGAGGLSDLQEGLRGKLVSLLSAPGHQYSSRHPLTGSDVVRAEVAHAAGATELGASVAQALHSGVVAR